MEDTKLKTEVKLAPPLTMEQYEEIMKRLGKVEGRSNGLTTPLSLKDRETKHYATVLFFRDRPVIKFDDIKSEEFIDKDGELQLRTSNKIGIDYLDGDKTEHKDVMTRSLLENGKRYKAEIISMEKEKVIVQQGILPQTVMSSPYDPAGIDGKKDFRSEQILLEQTLLKMTAKLKFIEGPLVGKELTVDVSCLNR